MYSRKAIIAATVGLHARPAAVFVRAVNQTGLPVELSKDGIDPVDGRSLLAVMSADFQSGTEVEVSVNSFGADEERVRAAVDMLASLLNTDLVDQS